MKTNLWLINRHPGGDDDSRRVIPLAIQRQTRVQQP
jgi:hypothetical protein